MAMAMASTPLFFSEHHTWATPDTDGHWLVGITDYAQDMLGDVVFIDPPKPGQTIVAAQACGLVESVKTGSDIIAPISGQVITINDALLTSPESLNDQPYQAWIFKVEAGKDAAQHLLDAAQYQSLIAG